MAVFGRGSMRDKHKVCALTVSLPCYVFFIVTPCKISYLHQGPCITSSDLWNSMLAKQKLKIVFKILIEGLCERTEHLDIFLFFPPITQWCSISDVLFTGGSNILLVKNNNYYSVNIQIECLHILIDCSQLSKTYYNVLFGSSTQDRHARRIYRQTFRE